MRIVEINDGGISATSYPPSLVLLPDAKPTASVVDSGGKPATSKLDAVAYAASRGSRRNRILADPDDDLLPLYVSPSVRPAFRRSDYGVRAQQSDARASSLILQHASTAHYDDSQGHTSAKDCETSVHKACPAG